MKIQSDTNEVWALKVQNMDHNRENIRKYNCLENHYRNISIVNGMNPYRDIQSEASTFLVDISGIVHHHCLSFIFIPNEARV